jgi:hypothetical protein
MFQNRILLASLLVSTSSATTVSVTPHDSYSSSVGVLGCKINTDRVAYWPGSVDCTNICVSLSYGGRTLKLLRIDQSGGAHDVSYDAWNYLYTGASATTNPTAGGGIQMETADLDASECADLIHTDDKRLPLSASNSMNFLASCLDQEDSWIAKNYVLYNILDPICTWGVDEKCTLDYPAQNQAQCPSGIGKNDALTTDPVYNIQYPSGKKVIAGSGQVVSGPTSTASGRWVGWAPVVTAIVGLQVWWVLLI